MTNLAEFATLLSSDQITRTKLADETGVLLDVDGLHVFSLNETGMFIVEALCNGVVDREGLVARLVGEFEVDEDTAGKDIDAFIEDLSRLLKKKQ